jgi:hypothetical protein
MSLFRPFSNPSRIFRNLGFQDAANLCELLRLARYKHATEPQDHIFALLGLVQKMNRAGDLDISLTPDYSKPLWTVYAEVVGLALELEENLGILKFRNHILYMVTPSTREGLVGLGTPNCESGDLVCILSGHAMPALLKRFEGHYIFLGGAYVHGIIHAKEDTSSTLDDEGTDRFTFAIRGLIAQRKYRIISRQEGGTADRPLVVVVGELGLVLLQVLKFAFDGGE